MQIATGLLPLFYDFKLLGKYPKIGQRVFIDVLHYGKLWSGKGQIRFQRSWRKLLLAVRRFSVLKSP